MVSARGSRDKALTPSLPTPSPLPERDEVGIALKRALPPQEFVIAATRARRVVVTHAGTRLVNRAAPRFHVEEHADTAVDIVLLMAQHHLVVLEFREAVLGDLGLDAEVAREPLQIARVDAGPLVAAGDPGGRLRQERPEAQ